MKDFLSLLFILVFSFAIITLMPRDFTLSGPWIVLPFAAIILVVAVSGLFAEVLADWWVQRRKERRLTRALAELFRTLEEVLEQSPTDTSIGRKRMVTG